MVVLFSVFSSVAAAVMLALVRLSLAERKIPGADSCRRMQAEDEGWIVGETEEEVGTNVRTTANPSPPVTRCTSDLLSLPALSLHSFLPL